MPGQNMTLSQPACQAGPRGIGPQARSEAARGGRPGTLAAATGEAVAAGGGGADPAAAGRWRGLGLDGARR